MLTLADALAQTLPDRDEWTSDALTSCGDDGDPGRPVVAVSVGWMRQSSPTGIVDAPILFVLTEDLLRLGQAGVAPGSAYAIPLASITALEAVDEPLTPHETIEVHFGESVVVVGWTSSFCQAVVAQLSAQDWGTRPGGSMPDELGDPSQVVGDVSSLDSIAAPSWTEPPVPPATPPPPPDWAVPADGSADDSSDAATPAGPVPVDGPPVPAASAGPVAPWHNPAMVWPDPLRGVAYVTGHPEHPRRRKNGTLTFTPVGWTAVGGGMSSWTMGVPWEQVEHISIQNAEELEFVEGLRIDATSSALCIQLVDASQVIFEVRMRRPPSLRAALAPVLLMVQSIPAWRAGV